MNQETDINLNELMKDSHCLLHWILPLEDEPKPYCVMGGFRTVKPFSKFQLVAIPAPGLPVIDDLESIDWEMCIGDLIKDPSIKVSVLLKSKYRVNEVNADFYSQGNV